MSTITVQNFHEHEITNALGLSVEARELQHVLDNTKMDALSVITGYQIQSYRQVEQNTESVREAFSEQITQILKDQPGLMVANEELQSSYQRAIRALLKSSFATERNWVIRLLWNQFNGVKPPEKTL